MNERDLRWIRERYEEHGRPPVECADAGPMDIPALLLEMESIKLENQVASACGVRLLARLADAEKVCKEAGRVIEAERLSMYQHAQACILCHQHKGHGQDCPMGQLIAARDAYLEGVGE
jgi:hypothetical protein